MHGQYHFLHLKDVLKSTYLAFLEMPRRVVREKHNANTIKVAGTDHE